MSERIETIRKDVEKHAGCTAIHLESTPVMEACLGQIVWEGVVETFELHEHPKAKRAYGWQRDQDCTVVLGIPPVDSPNKAVQGAIAAEAKNA